ncbi:MAG: hypothetical protein ABSF50_07655 [Burkholderiaceae bacterium]|jgi:hypothetical protein
MSTLPLQSIRLLRGNHEDVTQTGAGCFMNVISHLNGDRPVTDASPCVEPHVRMLVVLLNDFMEDGPRQALLQFIERAMRSRDKAGLTTLRCKERLATFRLELEALVKDYGLLDVPLFDEVLDISCCGTPVDLYCGLLQYTRRVRSAKREDFFSSYASQTAERKGIEPHRDVPGPNDLIENLFSLGLQVLDEILPPSAEPRPEILIRAMRLTKPAQAFP